MRACWPKWVGRDWSISADYIWLNFSDTNIVNVERGHRLDFSGVWDISFRDLPSKLQRFETTGKECLCSILRSSATGERRKELLFSITAISHRGSKS